MSQITPKLSTPLNTDLTPGLPLRLIPVRPPALDIVGAFVNGGNAARLLGSDQRCCAFKFLAFSASLREIDLASNCERTRLSLVTYRMENATALVKEPISHQTYSQPGWARWRGEPRSRILR
jgi:hypothetical protein